MTDEEMFEEFKNRKAALELEIKEFSIRFFNNGANQLFAKYPDIQNFSWVQFTKYFNDGDPCEFEAYIDYPEINGEDWSDDINPMKLVVFTEVRDFLRKFLDVDLYKQIAEDGVKVIVSREGITSEDYSHHD